MCVLLSSGCIQYQIVAFENPDIRNHPRISPRIFAIIQKFWGRVGCEKINVRWGTSNRRSNLTRVRECSTGEKIESRQ